MSSFLVVLFCKLFFCSFSLLHCLLFLFSFSQYLRHQHPLYQNISRRGNRSTEKNRNTRKRSRRRSGTTWHDPRQSTFLQEHLTMIIIAIHSENYSHIYFYVRSQCNICNQPELSMYDCISVIVPSQFFFLVQNQTVSHYCCENQRLHTRNEVTFLYFPGNPFLYIFLFIYNLIIIFPYSQHSHFNDNELISTDAVKSKERQR